MLTLSHKHNNNKKTHLQVKQLAQNSNNCWQKNLNANIGKNPMTLLGKTREKRRVREGESELDRRSRKGTEEEKGIPHPGKSPTWGKDQTNQRNLQMQRRV